MSTPLVQPEDDEEIEKIVSAFFESMKKWICPHCGKPVLIERQIGRCVYGHPCGCRLWQGKARGYRPANLQEKGGE